MRRNPAEQLALRLQALESETLDLTADQQQGQDEIVHDLSLLAWELKHLSGKSPSETFRTHSYQQLVGEIKKPRPKTVMIPDVIRYLERVLTGLMSAHVPAPVWAVALALMLIVTSSGVALASAEALPGDPLYPVKISIEEIRLTTTDDAGDVALQTTFAQRRLNEIEALIMAGRLEDVPVAAERFEIQITDAAKAFGSVAEHEADLHEQLAEHLKMALVQQVHLLSSLAEDVPPSTRVYLEHALDASDKAQTDIKGLAPDMQSDAPTPELAPQGTPGRDERSLAVPTATAAPEHTDVATPVATRTPLPTRTPKPPSTAQPGEKRPEGEINIRPDRTPSLPRPTPDRTPATRPGATPDRPPRPRPTGETPSPAHTPGDRHRETPQSPPPPGDENATPQPNASPPPILPGDRDRPESGERPPRSDSSSENPQTQRPPRTQQSQPEPRIDRTPSPGNTRRTPAPGNPDGPPPPSNASSSPAPSDTDGTPQRPPATPQRKNQAW
ncbi:MAG: hypothetical protein GY759_17920 [Chloroflexi bacterium]|nr:hypothetical protein [Chloroflexota bacterium]